MNLNPRKAQIIVTVEDATKTPAGILLPPNADKPYRTAVIRAIGPEVNVNLANDGKYVEKPDPHRLEVGMRVILTPHQGLPLEVDGKKYTMLNADGAFAVITDQ